MTDSNTEPCSDMSDEREQIYSALENEQMSVLRYYGGEPMVALVNRDAPTDNSLDGELVILVEWNQDDYALTLARGNGMNWELEDELVSIYDDRDSALDGAKKLFKSKE